MRKSRILWVLAMAFILGACGYEGDGEEYGVWRSDRDSGGGGGSGGGGVYDAVCQEVLDLMTESMNELCGDLYDFCCICICWNHGQVVTGMDEEYCYCGDPPGGELKLSINGECEGDVLEWAVDVLENGTWREKTEDMIVSSCSSGGGGGGGGSSICGPGEYECGCGACIDADYVCDGDPDCTWECGETSSSDEEKCGSSGGNCEPGEFVCDCGACVDADYVCDGDPDCEWECGESPSTDEEMCGAGSGGGGNECHSTGNLKCSGGYLWAVLRCDDGTEQLSSEIFYDCPCGCWPGSSVCDMC